MLRVDIHLNHGDLSRLFCNHSGIAHCCCFRCGRCVVDRRHVAICLSTNRPASVARYYCWLFAVHIDARVTFVWLNIAPMSACFIIARHDGRDQRGQRQMTTIWTTSFSRTHSVADNVPLKYDFNFYRTIRTTKPNKSAPLFDYFCCRINRKPCTMRRKVRTRSK